MLERPSDDVLDLAKELLYLMPRLLKRIDANIPHDAEDLAPEWHDILELRATRGQLKLLAVLTTHPRCTMQELAERLDVAPPTVTAMVKRLLTLGFVERVRDEEDWRVVRVLPTERGQRTIALYEEFWLTNIQHLLSLLNEEERALLRVALPVLHRMSELER